MFSRVCTRAHRTPSPKRQQWLHARVAAPVEDPRVKVTGVNVETFKRAVQLSGFVSSDAAMRQAIRVARGIKVVTSVKNDMRVK